MSTSRIVRAPRQAAILATIVGLHVGVAMLVVHGHPPRLEWLKPLPTIFVVLPKRSSHRRLRPASPGRSTTACRRCLSRRCRSRISGIPGPRRSTRATAEPGTGAGPGVPGPDCRGPSLRTRDSRLAALIDACYPAASRRLGEEGRVVSRPRSTPAVGRRLEHRGTLGIRAPRCGRRLRGPQAGIHSGAARGRGRGGERAVADRVPAGLIGSGTARSFAMLRSPPLNRRRPALAVNTANR